MAIDDEVGDGATDDEIMNCGAAHMESSAEKTELRPCNGDDAIAHEEGNLCPYHSYTMKCEYRSYGRSINTSEGPRKRCCYPNKPGRAADTGGL